MKKHDRMNRWFLQQSPTIGANVWCEIDAPSIDEHNALEKKVNDNIGWLWGNINGHEAIEKKVNDNIRWLWDNINGHKCKIHKLQKDVAELRSTVDAAPQRLREVFEKVLSDEYAEKFAWLGQQVEELRKERENVSRQMEEVQNLKAELESIKNDLAN